MSRPLQEINAGSMADIAFLLLIFFLVSTTMSKQAVIQRKLPPAVDSTNQSTENIRKRNILFIQITADNQLKINNNFRNINELKPIAIEFISNPNNVDSLSEKKMETIRYFGKTEISKGIILLDVDRQSSYETYIAVQTELIKSNAELRNLISIKKFGKIFELLNKTQMEAVSKIYPLSISEI